MLEYYGATSWAKLCLSGFRMKGWDDAAILRKAGISSDILNSDYCNFNTYNDLFRSAEAIYGNRACIEARKGMSANSFQSLSMAVLSAGSFYESLQLFAKHCNALTNGVEWFLTGDDTVAFGFTTRPDQEVLPAVAIAILTVVVRTTRFFFPNKNVMLQVELAHAKPAHGSSHVTDYFKTPIKWGSTRYAVHFCKHIVSNDSPFANRELMLKSEQNWLEEVAVSPEPSFLQKVLSFVKSNLGNEHLAIELVAKELTMSVRTLQRRLNSESTNFKQIVCQVRQSEALKLVTNTSMPITEVAYKLGLSDVGSLSRAFRRWYGSSPEQYRKEAS